MRTLDTDDRNRIVVELQKHTRPLTDPSPDFINIINRKVADAAINVSDALLIGDKTNQNFMKSLPDEFHSSITGRVKIMETMKKGIKVGKKMVYDMELLFNWLSLSMNSVECHLPSLTSLVIFAKGMEPTL